MSLANRFPHTSLCSGDAAEFADLSSVQDLIEEFLRKTLPEISPELTGWKPGKTAPRRENLIASDLCKLLNFTGSGGLFHFQHEDPENESGTRTLDMGTYPTQHLSVSGQAFGPLSRLYGIEAKRLPTPRLLNVDRSREYVVGAWNDRKFEDKVISGGIERFKELHHGKNLDRAGMIGFVQKHDFNHWHTEVNLWIDDLIANPTIQSHHATWANQDRLTSVAVPGLGVAEYHSNHARADGSGISLTHFWLDLTHQVTPKPEPDQTPEKKS